MRAIRRFTIRATLPEPLAPLRDLVLNLRWSWHAGTRELFAALDPAGREQAGSDPVALLGEIPPEHLRQLAATGNTCGGSRAAARDLREYLSAARWYQLSAAASSAAAAIAYFSPEYGIAAALPQYSGGLGILAGDHLKAASDLGVPLIGVGLLYRHGYFSQSLSPEGWQLERYPAGDPNGLPLTLLRDEDGRAGHHRAGSGRGPDSLAAQVWLAQVGRVPLLLLDSYVEQNEPRAARGHRPALRRRQRAPASAGAAARHGRRPGGAGVLRADRPPASPRCSTPTRATRASSAWSGSGSTRRGA